MKLDAGDLMSLQSYAACRSTYRQRAIAHRRARTVQLGPAMRLQFEDADTIRYQVQEVLHLERTTDPQAVRQELATYAHLLSDGTQWKASLLIELPNATERAREMPVLSEAAHRLYVQVLGQPCVFASANEDQPDRHNSRPSGVHFLCFQLSRAACVQSLAGAAVAIGCAHPGYPWRVLLPAATLACLRLDLAPAALLREGKRSMTAALPDARDGRGRFGDCVGECGETGALRLVRPLDGVAGAPGREVTGQATGREIERMLMDTTVYRWRAGARIVEPPRSRSALQSAIRSKFRSQDGCSVSGKSGVA